MSKRPRTLDSFFSPAPSKKSRNDETIQQAISPTTSTPTSNHKTLPFPIPQLPEEITTQLDFTPSHEGRVINHQPDLDIVYYQPYIPPTTSKTYLNFLRSELPFYRVQYNIKRGAIETQINTPRWTTVFGIDETSKFNSSGEIIDAVSGALLPSDTYKCNPRPIPECLDRLRILTENATSCKFNFALVNYYSSGNDSISYHSDDERFLGVEPAIASFTLGATRDFLLRHKKVDGVETGKPIKLPLASGDMVLMRGRTQGNWEHSIPKRKGSEAEKGRINITFRRAMVKGGTANYYRYNVGDGPVYKWDVGRREMVLWKAM